MDKEEKKVNPYEKRFENQNILEKCKFPKDKPASTMKDEYLPPHCYKILEKKVALRREKYRKEMIAQISAQLKEEQNAIPKVREYCTTYETYHHIPGFILQEEPPQESEAHLKYPLYSSNPVSIWTEKISKSSRGVAVIPGQTKVSDPTNPFKKYVKFTKPLDEQLDA